MFLHHLVDLVKVSHPHEAYLGMLSEDIEELFLMEDWDQIVDPKIYDEAMYDINFEEWMEVIKPKVDLMHSTQV